MKLLSAVTFLVCGPAVVGTACQSPQGGSNTAGTTGTELVALRSEVEEMKLRLGLQEGLTNRNLSDISDLKHESAVFDPSADVGFAQLDTSLGAFFVSLEDVRSFADGVRVELHVGNVFAATFGGTTFKAKWGPRTPTRQEGEGDLYERTRDRMSDDEEKRKENQLRVEANRQKREEWENSLRETEIKISSLLLPGQWNRVCLNLPDTEPSSFGHLELSMEVDQIVLSNE